MKNLYINNNTLATRINGAQNVSVGFDSVAKDGRFIFFATRARDFSTSEKRFDNNKFKPIYFQDNDFIPDIFIKKMKEKIIINNIYTVLVKVNYFNDDEDCLFCMLGEQLGINYNNDKDIDNILLNRFNTIKSRLIYYMNKYDAQYIDTIQVLYKVNNSFNQLKIKNINKVKIDKYITNIIKIKSTYNHKLLPLTVNEIHYGKRLNFDVKDNKVESLFIKDIDFISLIRNDSINNKNLKGFSINTRFYLRCVYDKEFIIVVNDLDNNKKIKHIEIYDLKGFIIARNIKDEILDNNSFVRTFDNTSITFKDNQVTKTNIDIKLPLLRYKRTKYKGTYNPFIGSFDVETYRDSDSLSKVYALGFSNLKMNEESEDKTTKFALTRNGNNNIDIMKNCLEKMFEVKNRNHIYYTHNLGGFDAVYLIHFLKNVNKEKGFEYYKLNTIFRDDLILRLTVKIPSKSGNNKIVFVDSYNLLIDSLDSLSKRFGSNIKKGKFPHKFVKNNTLNYIGVTPDKEYYDNITDSEYKELYKNNWSLMDESLKYLDQDLLSLLEIMDSFNKYVFINFNVQLTECLTISRLALNIFLKKYLGDTKLPVINNKTIYSSIKHAYYGGVVEIYKPYGKNLKYYDVNSLYPFASKNPMPGHICKYISSTKQLNLEELFGFFYCKVKTNDNYLGLLPVHEKGLIMPNGEWYGWYFSEELKYAKDKGYDIEVYKGYEFNKVYNVFDSFVDDLYIIKSNSTGSEKLIVKYILNSLLGRFGMSIDKLVSEIVSKDECDEILATREVNSIKDITSEDVLISYSNKISQKICEEHGLNYVDVLNSKSTIDLENLNSFDDVSISISAAVTSYARIYMSKVKDLIINNGGNVYYTDTDSIVTDICLPDSLVGKELGQFKLEYDVKEAYFISAKSYCLLLNDGKLVKKAKGVSVDSLTLDDYKNLYNKNNVQGIKKFVIKDLKQGSVTISTKPITLRHDSYIKREKLFNKNGRWIDTKPLQFRLYSSISKNLNNINNKLEVTITKQDKIQINEIIDLVKDSVLFKAAFTHKSSSNNIQLKTYETLEFLGDSILGCYVSKFIYTVYIKYDPGDMTKLKSLLVETKYLAKLSKEIGLKEYLIINENLPEETKINLINKDKTLADIFESFISTLYLEKGEDILLKFLFLTVFNNSKTKNKIEEFKKIFINSNIGRVSSLENSLNNKLLDENSSDIVIPRSNKSIHQITFKFEDKKNNEKKSDSLLDKNNQNILKELIKLQITNDNIIYHLKIQNNKDIIIHITDLKICVQNELKIINLNQQNLFKQIEKIHNSIEKLDINKLELYNRLNKIEYILYILITIIFINFTIFIKFIL